MKRQVVFLQFHAVLVMDFLVFITRLRCLMIFNGPKWSCLEGQPAGRVDGWMGGRAKVHL